MRIAVDLGYGFVKAMNKDGDKICFPSLIVNRSENSLNSIIGGSEEDYGITYWKTDGMGNKITKRCYVGEAAMAAGASARSWEEKQINNENLALLIGTAIALLSSDENIELSVGLPMVYYNKQKDEIKSMLENDQFNIEIIGFSIKKIHIKKVFVFPQGAGAYWGSIFNVNGEVKDIKAATSSIGLIDIGYRTVDYLVMSKGRKGMMLNDSMTDSLETDGMNKVYQLIQKRLTDELGKEINIIKIEQAILWYEGQLDYRGKTINLRQYEEDAYKDLAGSIVNKIKMRWEGEIDVLQKIIVTGGGGKSLFPYIKEKIERAELQGESEYANCLGYLVSAKMASEM